MVDDCYSLKRWISAERPDLHFCELQVGRRSYSESNMGDGWPEAVSLSPACLDKQLSGMILLEQKNYGLRVACS